MHIVTALILAATILLPSASFAHTGGPLDRYGCHTDRRSGEYHCHRRELRGMHFKSKSEMLEKRRRGELSASAPTPPPSVSDRGVILEQGQAPPKKASGWSRWNPFSSSKPSKPAALSGTAIVPRGIERRLLVLRDLYEKNLITEEEYAAKRKEILGDL